MPSPEHQEIWDVVRAERDVFLVSDVVNSARLKEPLVSLGIRDLIVWGFLKVASDNQLMVV